MRIERAAVRAACVGLAMLTLAATAARNEVPIGQADAETDSGRAFVSRPDLDVPLILTKTYGPPGAIHPGDDDLVFVAPKDGAPMTGPLILDADGEPVWIHPLDNERAYDLRVQEYHGKPVLTWWRGLNLGVGYGYGRYQIMDQHYRVIATVTTRGSLADHHGMTLTDDGTALLITYRKAPYDLSDLGGPEDGYVVNEVIQEVDVETGKVVFSWSGLDHVPVEQTEARIGPDSLGDGTLTSPLDYLPRDLSGRPRDRQGGLDPRRQGERLPDAGRLEVRLAARRPSAAGRDDHAVRQRGRPRDA